MHSNKIINVYMTKQLPCHTIMVDSKRKCFSVFGPLLDLKLKYNSNFHVLLLGSICCVDQNYKYQGSQ